MTESTAAIYGIEGLQLNDSEKAFFKETQPWGYILFARNVESETQLIALTDSLRALSGRDDVPIFIDQEGGRVQRIKPPLAELYPAGEKLGDLYRLNKEQGLRATWLMSRLHAFDLARFGINSDCLPVLDVPVKGAHDVIGNRAYGYDAETVTDLGRAAADGLLAGNCLPVIKHIPGHGRAASDSHKDLPIVDTPLDVLRAQDFAPFGSLSHYPMAMTAHVVYTALDASAPATTSKHVIDTIIRDEMGFDGLLMSDDVSMHALSGDFSERSRSILRAGCDVVLHCNGVMAELEAVAKEVPELSGDALRRANATTSLLKEPLDGSVEAECREEFLRLMANLNQEGPIV